MNSVGLVMADRLASNRLQITMGIGHRDSQAAEANEIDIVEIVAK